MTNYHSRLFLMVVTILLSSYNIAFGANQPDAVQLFNQGNIAYQKKDYGKAIEHYNSALTNGGTSASLEFNLGNAYYKDGQIAKAILHYERAQRLSPADEDIAFNLRIAALKTVDKIDVMPEIFYKRWANAAISLFSERTWSILLIISVWLVFAALLIYFLAKTITLKKLAFGISLFGVACTLIFYFLATSRKSNEYENRFAVIMAASAYVKSSPDEKGNDLLILHEGTKVNVLDELGDWKKIRIANGTIGWINISAIETI